MRRGWGRQIDKLSLGSQAEVLLSLCSCQEKYAIESVNVSLQDSEVVEINEGVAGDSGGDKREGQSHVTQSQDHDYVRAVWLGRLERQ